MFTASSIAQFWGSENYFFNPMFKSVNYTDGVKFISDNGAGWLITDCLAIIEGKRLLKNCDGFIAITCKPDTVAKTCMLTMTDGDETVVHTQKYDITDLPCEVCMFCERSHPKAVLMLTSER